MIFQNVHLSKNLLYLLSETGNGMHPWPFSSRDDSIINYSISYIGAFIGGAIAGAAIGLLMAPEKGTDTRTKISDAVSDFCKKHNLNISRKDMEDLVDDIKDAAAEAID